MTQKMVLLVSFTNRPTLEWKILITSFFSPSFSSPPSFFLSPFLSFSYFFIKNNRYCQTCASNSNFSHYLIPKEKVIFFFISFFFLSFHSHLPPPKKISGRNAEQTINTHDAVVGTWLYAQLDKAIRVYHNTHHDIGAERSFL